MRTTKRSATLAAGAVAALVWLAAPSVGLAQAVPPTLTADNTAVNDATKDINAGGILAVATHEKPLLDVMEHAPSGPLQDTVRDGVQTHYALSSDLCLRFLATAAVSGRGKVGHDAPNSYACDVAPYAIAALYLGSYYNEKRQPTVAVAVLDRGLVAAPDAAMLITERNAAYIALGRMDDVLAGADRGLALPDLADSDRARLLRNRGYALTEFKRLDEAQQAYEASLKLQPDNAVARSELEYIAKLKGGAAPTTGGIVPLTPQKP